MFNSPGKAGVLLSLILSFFCTQALGAKNIYTGWFSNKAVSGYDTVAYYTLNKATKGTPQFKYEYAGTGMVLLIFQTSGNV